MHGYRGALRDHRNAGAVDRVAQVQAAVGSGHAGVIDDRLGRGHGGRRGHAAAGELDKLGHHIAGLAVVPGLAPGSAVLGHDEERLFGNLGNDRAADLIAHVQRALGGVHLRGLAHGGSGRGRGRGGRLAADLLHKLGHYIAIAAVVIHLAPGRAPVDHQEGALFGNLIDDCAANLIAHVQRALFGVHAAPDAAGGAGGGRYGGRGRGGGGSDGRAGDGNGTGGALAAVISSLGGHGDGAGLHRLDSAVGQDDGRAVLGFPAPDDALIRSICRQDGRGDQDGFTRVHRSPVGCHGGNRRTHHDGAAGGNRGVVLAGSGDHAAALVHGSYLTL